MGEFLMDTTHAMTSTIHCGLMTTLSRRNSLSKNWMVPRSCRKNNARLICAKNKHKLRCCHRYKYIVHISTFCFLNYMYRGLKLGARRFVRGTRLTHVALLVDATLDGEVLNAGERHHAALFPHPVCDAKNTQTHDAYKYQIHSICEHSWMCHDAHCQPGTSPTCTA